MHMHAFLSLQRGCVNTTMKEMVAMDGEPNLNDDINYVQIIFVSFWSYLVGFHGYQPPGYATNTHRHRFFFFPLVLFLLHQPGSCSK